MKIWITKHALTSGIVVAEGTINQRDETSVMVRHPEASFNEYYYGEDWHRDAASAVARAEDMRERKLRAIEKQIEKLKALNFAEFLK